MTNSEESRRARAAWDRIESLGGFGVWESDVCIVSFADTTLTDADLCVFDDFPYVETLDLSRTGVTGHGLLSLVALPRLEQVTIVGTSVDDVAVAEFRTRRPNVAIVSDPPETGSENPFTGKPFGQ